MYKIEACNGVFIFIVLEQCKFVILGDKGINEKVFKDFWLEEWDIMFVYFKSGNYVDGVCVVVQQVGVKLKAFFFYQFDDENELFDDILYS